MQKQLKINLKTSQVSEPKMKVQLLQLGSLFKPAERKKRVGSRPFFSRCFWHEKTTINESKTGDPFPWEPRFGKLWADHGDPEGALACQETVLKRILVPLSPRWQALGHLLASRTPWEHDFGTQMRATGTQKYTKFLDWNASKNRSIFQWILTAF